MKASVLDQGWWIPAFAHSCSVKAVWIPAFAVMIVRTAYARRPLPSFPRMRESIAFVENRGA